LTADAHSKDHQIGEDLSLWGCCGGAGVRVERFNESKMREVRSWYACKGVDSMLVMLVIRLVDKVENLIQSVFLKLRGVLKWQWLSWRGVEEGVDQLY